MEYQSKLYVGNLPYSINDKSLRELFEPYGQVVEAKVIIDKFSGRSKGFGFVTMENEESAKRAIEGVNNKEMEDRALTVNVARPMRPRENHR